MSMAIERLDWTNFRKPYNQSVAELNARTELDFAPEFDELDESEYSFDLLEIDMASELTGSENWE